MVIGFVTGLFYFLPEVTLLIIYTEIQFNSIQLWASLELFKMAFSLNLFHRCSTKTNGTIRSTDAQCAKLSGRAIEPFKLCVLF